MHTLNVNVPKNWTKFSDLIDLGRDEFKFELDKTYYIHNNSDFVIYLIESEVEPAQDAEAIKIYAGKSAGYVKASGDLYVCTKLPDVYPNPETVGILLSEEVKAISATAIGDYKPEKDVKGAYVFKGSAESRKALPEDAEIGDVYNIVEEDGMNVAWTGSMWDDLGATINIDLSPYAKKEDVDAKVEAINTELALKATKEEMTEALAKKAESSDVVALDAEVDSIKADVDAALKLKADKTELDSLATKKEVQDAIASVDHSTYATKAEVDVKANKSDVDSQLALKADKTSVSSELKKKVDGTITGTDGQAKIFNETSGGGAQFINTKKNTISYVGVNDGNDGVFVQIYSKNKSTNVGARLNAAPEGIFYTNGKTNGSYEASNELVTKADLEKAVSDVDHSTFATKDEIHVMDASITSALARMSVLEERMSNINKTDVEPVIIEGDVPEMKDETKDYVVKGDLTASAAKISGKSITLSGVTLSKESSIVGTAQGDVDVKDMSIQGEYPVTPSNVILDFAADGYVTIKDTDFNVGTYNAINIGLRQPGPKGVLIDNVDFRGKCRNNAISVYSTQENAVININNCYFENVSNAIRVCNSTNTSCTVNITNCRCDKWEENLKYTGLFLCEDIISQSAEEVAANNFFGNGKVVINISNLILPNGEKLTAQDLASICGTQDANQIFYVHDPYNKVRAYSEEVYPVINIV